MDDYPAGFDDLRVRFVFVPDGAPVPWDWMADWIDIVRVPATLVLKYAAEEGEGDAAQGQEISPDYRGPDEAYYAPTDFGDEIRKAAFLEGSSDASIPLFQPYRSHAPHGSVGIHHRESDGAFRIAARGDLRCEGFEAGCSQGGSYGATAMFSISGSRLCWDCAVKMMGIQDDPGAEKSESLRPFLIRPP